MMLSIPTFFNIWNKKRRSNIIGLSTEEDTNAIAIFVPPNYTGSKAIPFLIGGGIKLPFIAPKC